MHTKIDIYIIIAITGLIMLPLDY